MGAQEGGSIGRSPPPGAAGEGAKGWGEKLWFKQEYAYKGSSVGTHLTAINKVGVAIVAQGRAAQLAPALAVLHEAGHANNIAHAAVAGGVAVRGGRALDAAPAAVLDVRPSVDLEGQGGEGGGEWSVPLAGGAPEDACDEHAAHHAHARKAACCSAPCRSHALVGRACHSAQAPEERGRRGRRGRAVAPTSQKSAGLPLQSTNGAGQSVAAQLPVVVLNSKPGTQNSWHCPSMHDVLP